MGEWFQKAVDSVTPDSEMPVLVLDIDGILRFPEIRQGCEERGFTVVDTNAGIEVRLLFETRLRGTSKNILAVQGPYAPLPDIRTASHVVEISLETFFPNMDGRALKGLGLDALAFIDSVHPYTRLGFDSTVRFILENLFHVDVNALEHYKTLERALAACISVMFNKEEPNTPVKEYLKKLLTPFFKADTEKLIQRDSLADFLKAEGSAAMKGTSRIDFSEPLLNQSMNVLYITGLLERVLIGKEEYDALPPQLRSGYRTDEKTEGMQSQLVRITELNAFLKDTAPGIQNQADSWFALAPLIGEMGALVYRVDTADMKDEFTARMDELNHSFQLFVEHGYWSLHSLSGRRHPMVVHKILDYINAAGAERKALLVIDGMNLWQWHILKSALVDTNLKVHDLPAFAWLPSITAWSRQALFKGSRPDLDQDNRKEEKLFREYWKEKTIPDFQISFGEIKWKNLPEAPGTDIHIAAFICNDLDSMMHGTVLGNRELYLKTEEWVKNSGVLTFIENLVRKKFSLYITTDHGNLEAESYGNLKANIKNLATSRSKRHVHFTTETDAKKFLDTYPHISARRAGQSVYLTDNKAFIPPGTVITHGGSHLLELLIPLGVIT